MFMTSDVPIWQVQQIQANSLTHFRLAGATCKQWTSRAMLSCSTNGHLLILMSRQALLHLRATSATGPVELEWYGHGTHSSKLRLRPADAAADRIAESQGRHQAWSSV